MSFNDRYWKMVLGKALWMNPLWIVFCLVVMIGTVVGKHEDSLPMDLFKSVIGLALLGPIFVLPFALWQHAKANKTEEPPQRQPARPLNTRTAKGDDDEDAILEYRD